MRILATIVTFTLFAGAAAAQSAMPTQTPIPQTAMPDQNQNVVRSDFSLWPPPKAPVTRMVVPPYRRVSPVAHPAIPPR